MFTFGYGFFIAQINEERREKLREQQEEELRRKAHMTKVEEHRRRLVLEETAKKDEERVDQLLQKQDEVRLSPGLAWLSRPIIFLNPNQAEKVLDQVKADQEREHELRKERRRLIKQAKLDNIERQKRREEYQRMKLLKQMEERNRKVEVRVLAFPCFTVLVMQSMPCAYLETRKCCMSGRL